MSHLALVPGFGEPQHDNFSREGLAAPDAPTSAPSKVGVSAPLPPMLAQLRAWGFRDLVLQPRGEKKPYRRGDWSTWRKLSDAQLAHEARSAPEGYGVAMLTGGDTGLVVIELDAHGAPLEEAAKQLALLQQRAGVPLPKTVTWVSGGGGMAMVFRSGRPCATTDLAPGVEVKGINGKQTMPPTVHKSGQPYQWVNSPADCAISQLPWEWTRLLPEPTVYTAPTPPRNADGTPRVFTDDDVTLGMEKARKLLASVESVQGRNGSKECMRAAGIAVRWSTCRVDAEEMLGEWNQLHAQPTWSDNELGHKLDDAEKTSAYGEWLVEEKPVESVPPSVADLTAAVDALVTPSAAKNERYGFLKSVVDITAESFLADPEPVVYLWDKLIPDEAGTVGILGGAGGLGKTSLLVGLAVRRACGLDYLGRKTKPGKTFVVSLEEHSKALMRRLAAARDTTPGVDAAQVAANVKLLPQSAASAGWMMVNEERSGRFTPNTEAVVELAAAIKTTLPGCDLVVMETVSRLTPNEDNPAAAALIKAGELLGSILGAVVIFVHHVNKAASSSGSVSTESLRGASAFANNARFALMMAPYTKAEAQRLLPGTQPYPEEMATRLELLLLYPSKGNETKRSDRAAAVVQTLETRWAAAFKVYDPDSGKKAVEDYERQAATRLVETALPKLLAVIQQHPETKFTQRTLMEPAWKTLVGAEVTKENISFLVNEAAARGLLIPGPKLRGGTHPTLTIATSVN